MRFPLGTLTPITSRTPTPHPNPTPTHARTHQVTCPGAYRTICVQLRLHHLAVAALLKAQELAEMEGASGLDGLGAGAPAFGVLRRLVEVGGWVAAWLVLGSAVFGGSWGAARSLVAHLLDFLSQTETI